MLRAAILGFSPLGFFRSCRRRRALFPVLFFGVVVIRVLPLITCPRTGAFRACCFLPRRLRGSRRLRSIQRGGWLFLRAGRTPTAAASLPTLGPPPKIDGSVLVSELPPPSSSEDCTGHSSHTQQVRLLPALCSRAVTAFRPKRNEIPAATTLLPTKRDQRRHRPPGGEENPWYGAFVPVRPFRLKR